MKTFLFRTPALNCQTLFGGACTRLVLSRHPPKFSITWLAAALWRTRQRKLGTSGAQVAIVSASNRLPGSKLSDIGRFDDYQVQPFDTRICTAVGLPWLRKPILVSLGSFGAVYICFLLTRAADFDELNRDSVGSKIAVSQLKLSSAGYLCSLRLKFVSFGSKCSLCLRSIRFTLNILNNVQKWFFQLKSSRLIIPGFGAIRDHPIRTQSNRRKLCGQGQRHGYSARSELPTSNLRAPIRLIEPPAGKPRSKSLKRLIPRRINLVVVDGAPRSGVSVQLQPKSLVSGHRARRAAALALPNFERRQPFAYMERRPPNDTAIQTFVNPFRPPAGQLPHLVINATSRSPDNPTLLVSRYGSLSAERRCLASVIFFRPPAGKFHPSKLKTTSPINAVLRKLKEGPESAAQRREHVDYMDQRPRSGDLFLLIPASTISPASAQFQVIGVAVAAAPRGGANSQLYISPSPERDACSNLHQTMTVRLPSNLKLCCNSLTTKAPRGFKLRIYDVSTSRERQSKRPIPRAAPIINPNLQISIFRRPANFNSNFSPQIKPKPASNDHEYTTYRLPAIVYPISAPASDDLPEKTLTRLQKWRINNHVDTTYRRPPRDDLTVQLPNSKISTLLQKRRNPVQ
ncbi:hypothetical protein R3P38DRAFT_3507423 [Favolaschia claudopus]|uniref:Uncharacterized protein n=1 Tax=Favolaschia claudopus TaxID=2862362 RepID=A0AAW0BYZ5_9AGAR